MLHQKLDAFSNLEIKTNRKGALIASWHDGHKEPLRGLTAHVDTLGAMVKEIKSNGRLKLSKIGGYAWNTIEGEGCQVIKTDGSSERGSILLSMASSHVHGSKVSDVKRDDDNMEVRLDARTSSAVETIALGIQVGDFIAFDPRFEFTNGFIRSRHLDDKACVACIVEAIGALQRAGLNPLQPTCFHFSNYEEVGHGASTGFSDSVEELITVDMAAVGDGQSSDEFSATLCVKDSGGPYHHGLSQRLRKLADKYDIPYKVDIYPYYGSDGEAFWRAGGDVSVALIGPGVDASHNYERTHIEALIATTRWIMAYLLE
jgi:putative aminopeptidase FrvX